MIVHFEMCVHHSGVSDWEPDAMIGVFEYDHENANLRPYAKSLWFDIRVLFWMCEMNGLEPDRP